MSTDAGFHQAVQIAKANPELRVGAYLVLNETRPLSDPAQIPCLVRKGGAFHDSPNQLALTWLSGKLSSSEIMNEWWKQLERTARALGTVSHLDSHKHVHLFPPALKVMIQLAKEFGVPRVRLPMESISGVWLRRFPSGLVLWILCLAARRRLDEAGLVYADRFYGFVHSGKMTAQLISAATEAAGAGGHTEIMVHPAVVTEHVRVLQQRFSWAARYQFEKELEALIVLRRGSGWSD